jgi:hypothetical protein
VSHDWPGEWLVRVRAFDEEQETGPWSDWSEGYDVRPNMACAGSGRIGTPDFNCFRRLYGLCIDAIGYHECLEP